MWNLLVIEPMVNALMWLYSLFNNNFVLALAVFTLAVRFAMLPMTLKQQKATMKQQEMQPQIQAIQKKYRDNPQKMQEEFQKIGYNPADTLMGCLPLVIQMPIFFGLYRAIFLIMGSTPLSVLQLTERIYPSIASLVDLPNVLPITNNFLWLNMAQPDPLLILPILVAATMFLQQKLSMPPTQPNASDSDNPMANMSKQMMYTMPLMFGFFSLSFPSGLSVYFILSNLVGIGQGFIIRRNREQMDAERAQQKKAPAAERAEQIAEESRQVAPQAQANGASSGDNKSNAKPQSKRKRKSAKR
ncbi:MAG: membrane protein insertase YidC [Anaerolineales bacterium]|nr:membrane protein insertase YidC [Anaerolineales bacterium]MCB0012523.1 membrane protein insertase YidC [Anaerolineales bacterium]MCB0031330.1 membrane protein insertase YidC [Anaerolineales bacterium]